MPVRTLAVFRITVSKRLEKDTLEPLDGIGPANLDLLALINAFLRDLPPDDLRDETRHVYTAITKVAAAGDSLMVSVETGIYNEKGSSRNVYSHEVTQTYGEEDSPGLPARMIFIAPHGGTAAYLMYERVGGVQGFTPILRVLGPALRTRMRIAGYTFHLEAVDEGEAWLAASELERVNVYELKSEDLADQVNDVERTLVGRIKHSLSPPKGEGAFPRWIWENLLARQIKPESLLGFGDLTEGSDDSDDDIYSVEVTASANGRTKTFVLDSPNFPSARRLLASADAEAPDDNQFIAACKTAFVDYTGNPFADDWLTGAWPDELLELQFWPEGGDPREQD